MNKKRVFIWGSCVSRDTFSHLPEDEFALVEYVARQSAISAYAKPVTTLRPPVLESRFQQRMITNDFNSGLRSSLQNAGQDVDLLIIDLADERLGVYVLPDGSVVTRTVELIRAGAESKFPPGTRHVAFGTSDHLHYWQLGMRAMAAIVTEMMPNAVVALIDVPWAEETTTGEPSPASFGLTAKEANAILPRYTDTVREAFPAVTVTIAAAEIRSAPSHVRGNAPFHYEDDVYTELAATLSNLRTTRSPGVEPADRVSPDAATSLSELRTKLQANQTSALHAHLRNHLTTGWSRHLLDASMAQSRHEFYAHGALFAFVVSIENDLCLVRLESRNERALASAIGTLQERGIEAPIKSHSERNADLIERAIPSGVIDAPFSETLAEELSGFRRGIARTDAPLAGYVDHISDDAMTLTGWVRTAMSGPTPDIFAHLGDKTLARAETGASRPDVTERLGISNARFTLRLPAPLTPQSVRDGSFGVEADGIPLIIGKLHT